MGSYPENKRNGVGFSDKMPEWYGFAGSICNFGAGYTGGVIQNCDDCQLKYGGPATTAAWKAEKPPAGAPLGTGQLATIVDIEYQLPADFECPNAVFSWLWHTPHLCIPKEVADKRAENDFWAFCNRNLEGFYGACRTEWQDEIFINCMDAQVGDGGNFSSPSQPLSPEPISQPVPQPAPQPQAAAPSEGDCVSIGPSYYAATCASVAANCELYSTICKRVSGSGGAPGPAPAAVPCIAADDPIYSAACEALAANCEQYSFCTRASLTQTSARRQIRLRRSAGNALLQHSSNVQDGIATENEDLAGTELEREEEPESPGNSFSNEL